MLLYQVNDHAFKEKMFHSDNVILIVWAGNKLQMRRTTGHCHISFAPELSRPSQIARHYKYDLREQDRDLALTQCTELALNYRHSRKLDG